MGDNELRQTQKMQLYVFLLLILTVVNLFCPGGLSRSLQLTKPIETMKENNNDIIVVHKDFAIKTIKEQTLNSHHDGDIQQALMTSAVTTTTTMTPSATSATTSATSATTTTTTTTTTTATKTDFNHIQLCPDILVDAGAKFSSTSHVWYQLQRRILEASYYVHPEINKFNTTMMKAYTDWVGQLFSFYTPSRLRRSIMNPAQPKTIVQLLKLVNEIKHHNNMIDIYNNTNINNNTTSNTDEEEEDVKIKNKKRKLRILVLGGSVTAGHGCIWPTTLELQQRNGNVPQKDCAWSIRLEKLLNDVIFNGEQIVHIDNMAMGGMSSEWGALVLEYRLYSNNEEPPDVIISAYSANDSREPYPVEKVYREMENFVLAANNIQPCNNNAPLVILVDDLYGNVPYLSSRHTSKMYMLSTWYNVMAIDYSNIVKYKVFTENIGMNHPLLTSPFNVHNGVGMHTGLSWTILFNIINSIVNVCNDVDIGLEQYHLLNNNNTNDYINPKQFYIPSKDVTNTNSNTTTSNSSSSNNNNNSMTSPIIIDRELIPNLKKGEPPFQHFGFIGQGVGKSGHVAEHLKQNIIKNNKICNHHMNNNNNKHNNNKQKQKCSYGWIIDRSIGFAYPQLVQEEMNKILLYNDGWIAEGNANRRPRTGWYAKKPNATFTIQINNTKVDTNIILLLSMKSYNINFTNSKLAISTTVIKKNNKKKKTNNNDGTTTTTTNVTNIEDWDTTTITTNNNNNSNNNKDNNSNNIFYIDGYHTTNTSVHFPHKIPVVTNNNNNNNNNNNQGDDVGGSGAKAGDSIILNAKLISGSYFKIAGLAFCSF